MNDISKREKFLFWLIQNSYKWWLWVLVIIATSILVNAGPFLAGLGVVLFGVLTFAAGINLTLEEIKNKEKEKTNDATN